MSVFSQARTDWPDVACCSPDLAMDDCCACAPMERALRGWIGGRAAAPMTADQREACLVEIEAVEGHERKDYDGADDAMLARGVLGAWTDYCRDKGLM